MQQNGQPSAEQHDGGTKASKKDKRKERAKRAKIHKQQLR